MEHLLYNNITIVITELITRIVYTSLAIFSVHALYRESKVLLPGISGIEGIPISSLRGKLVGSLEVCDNVKLVIIIRTCYN